MIQAVCNLLITDKFRTFRFVLALIHFQQIL